MASEQAPLAGAQPGPSLGDAPLEALLQPSHQVVELLLSFGDGEAGIGEPRLISVEPIPDARQARPERTPELEPYKDPAITRIVTPPSSRTGTAVAS